MSIPAGHIITVGGLNVIDRLQDAGLQNPKVPTEVIRETGNDLVVGKVLTEADFQFQMTSWDVSCDMMALLTGKKGGTGATEGPAAGDAAGTPYKWENCQFINLTCPWAKDTGSEGGDITSGVLIPAYYPTALSYKFGVTANAEQSVTLNGGSYYQADTKFPATVGAYPIEGFGVGTGAALSLETAEEAMVYRIGGFGATAVRHVFGVLVDGVIQQEGVDYIEEGGLTLAEAAAKEEKGENSKKKVKIKFITLPKEGAIIRYCYFSAKPAHQIPQAAHASTVTTPAAVRGRNIEIFIADTVAHLAEAPVLLRGVQTLDLNATTTGSVQREMGTQDPIGYNVTGTDTNGTITLDPKEEAALYVALETMTGIKRQEILGYLNEHTIAMKAVIRDPKSPATILKSIHVGDAKFQIPGTTARVNQTLSLPISFESEAGTFEEVKGE